MKILVTGGAGFIASHIVDTYIRLGHQVVVVDNLSTGKKEFINKKSTFYRADIRKKKDISRIINKEKPQVINHHAAQISVRVSVEDPSLDAQVNLLGLINLVEAGRLNGLEKIIFASSGGVVYGEADKIPTPEDYYPLSPLSPYGVTKLASEYYLNYYHLIYGIPYIALRYSNVYGPRQNPHGEAGVVAIFIKKILRGLRPVINGNGRQTRDYIYVGDVARANVLALQTKKTGAFNIGTGVESDVLKIYSTIKELLQAKVKAVHGPAKKGEQLRSCLVTVKAQKVLDWQWGIELRRGISETVEYFKKDEK
ncbi:UDP-glucose 4-epimerase [Candidatus Gottesmanbacteria bacterium RBG_13_37_7]|uniref:UDP-glucose 4-epimerase n=1 Tax=Candidatus Gottesmanbacteria bacterium RBG_13_37_7 TaxID=1798369 RepID=A0A1F5YJ99_9BACT|nr:MAG: UDP-glucose 4-epimerase [Candidatus Gottesmanbacteria bacterium RBG_13_37_7]